MTLSKFNIDLLNKIVKIIATYSYIQILAHDKGIKSGKKQICLAQNRPIQIIMLWCSAYVLINDVYLATGAVALYYFLKVIYSDNIEANKCE